MKHAIVTAAEAASFGTTNLSQWIRDNVVTLIVLLVAVVVLWAGKSGNISKVVTIVACFLVGLAVLGMATGTNAADIGDWITGLLRSK